MSGRNHRSTRGRRPRRNPAHGGGLSGLPVEQRSGAVSADTLNLTREERELLPDPNWVTEDDADFIVARRRELSEPALPLAQILKKHGYRRLAG